MTEDWAAVARVINERVKELGWQQRELARRSRVSQAIVREIQHHTVERRRSARTLEALSVALGWHPQYLAAVLRGRRPPEPDEDARDDGDTVWSRLETIDLRLNELGERLDEVDTKLNTMIAHISSKR